MHWIDSLIIISYLLLFVCVGLVFRKKASKSINEYFLGGRSIPWWVLGVSGMSGNVDLTGTMLIASFFYIIGVKGFLIELRGGVVLILSILMIFLGKWYSRSKVMTVAEWMQFRFGDGPQGNAARLLSAISNVVGSIGMIAYLFIGSVKFISYVLPLPSTICCLILFSVSLFYTTMSGLYGIAYIEIIQASLVLFATIFFSIKAYLSVNLASITAIAPSGWTSLMPSWHMNMPPGYEIYNLFGISVMFFFFKTMLEGIGGPGSYMAQRYFAARNDRDSSLLSMIWIVLMSFRWPFIIAIAVLGLSLQTQITDPELVLPIVLMTVIPIGLKGLLIAALLTAAMSTFDSTVNGSAVYMVKDIYQKYLRPEATEKQLVHASYISSIIIVFIGITIGWFAPSINFIWGWITMSLSVGMILPLVFRWFWWRFNGYGFAIGTASGMLSAIAIKLVSPSLPEWTDFIIVCLISIIAIIAGTLLTEPTDEKVLKNFFIVTRPFGRWKPITSKMQPELLANIHRENRRDLIAVFFAIPWQLSLFLMLIYIIIHKWDMFFILLFIFLICSTALYFVWYRNLRRNKETNHLTKQVWIG